MVALGSSRAETCLVSMQNAGTQQIQSSMLPPQSKFSSGAVCRAGSDPLSVATPVWSEQCRVAETLSPSIQVDLSNSGFAVLRFIEKLSAEDTLVKMGLVSPLAPQRQPGNTVQRWSGSEFQHGEQPPPGLELSPWALSYGSVFHGRGTQQPCGFGGSQSGGERRQLRSHCRFGSECSSKACRKQKAGSKNTAGMTEAKGKPTARKIPKPLACGERAPSTELAVLRLGLLAPKANMKSSAVVEPLGSCFSSELCEATVSCSESTTTVAGSDHDLVAALSSEDDIPFTRSAEMEPKATVEPLGFCSSPLPCRAMLSCSKSITTVGGSDHDLAAAQSFEDDLHSASARPMPSGSVHSLSTSCIQLASSPVELQQSCQLSNGSTSHGTGECQPCAWFWKPHGCQNGAACEYCHLCPEGEIKSRRKQKLAALRSGVDAPMSKSSSESLVD